jgi:ABC-type antimicrobial peptide transport system permease subunit
MDANQPPFPQEPTPPRWVDRLLDWFCAPHKREEVLGDLHERYHHLVAQLGEKPARRQYLWEVLAYLRPSVFKRKFGYPSSRYTQKHSLDMLSHHLLLAYRNFTLHKSSFFINLTGLSTGLAAALLIYLWVHDEWQVDRFHEKDRRLYQIMTKRTSPDGNVKVGHSGPSPLAEALAADLPEVEYAVPVRWTGSPGVVKVGDKAIRAVEQLAGKDYFNVFSYPLLEGSKEKALTDKTSVLISDALATSLFGTSRNVTGKTVAWDKNEFSGNYQVAGVFKKPPYNATVQFDLIFPFDLYRDTKSREHEWFNGGTHTYVVLKEETDLARFNQKISTYLQPRSNDPQWSVFARRYADQHLYDQYENGLPAGGRITYVKLFSLIAVFILVIAAINFMNLSTAKASRRIKEIGVKKAVGAGRKTLVFQFLSESVLIAYLSLIIAIILIALLLPEFNHITGKQLSLSLDPAVVLSMLAITLLTGMLAGSYPALYLSGFKPVAVLKGRLDRVAGEAWARKGLVVFQFALSVILIVAVLVVYKQTEYIHTKNLGYDKDNIILFKREGKLNENLSPFLDKVKNTPNVVDASAMWGNMTEIGNMTTDLSWKGKKTDDKTEFGEFGIGYGLIETLGIQVKAGRSFSWNFGSDSANVILNEAAVAAMGLEDPVGKTIKYGVEDKQIVGVVKNFHLESLYEPLKPVFMVLAPYADQVVVKIRAGKERETIARLQTLFEEYNAGLPFEYQFLDQGFGKLYEAEERVAVLSRYFAGIAILISCLGLFGLAAFTAERRSKEIGIRKILGATDFGIMRLLSVDFIGLVLAAILVALPLSYLVARHWLNEFTYKINLAWWFFAGPGVVVLLIAWTVVAVQTLKATRIAPTLSLRSE